MTRSLLLLLLTLASFGSALHCGAEPSAADAGPRDTHFPAFDAQPFPQVDAGTSPDAAAQDAAVALDAALAPDADVADASPAAVDAGSPDTGGGLCGTSLLARGRNLDVAAGGKLIRSTSGDYSSSSRNMNGEVVQDFDVSPFDSTYLLVVTVAPRRLACPTTITLPTSASSAARVELLADPGGGTLYSSDDPRATGTLRIDSYDTTRGVEKVAFFLDVSLPDTAGVATAAAVKGTANLP